MPQPKIIFLDAVGTLFGVRGSVGEAYSMIARHHSVDVQADTVNQAFFDAFAAADPLECLGVPSEAIAMREFEWWLDIARHTFKQVGVFEQFANFTEFFDELYLYFSTAEPWFVYPDVRPALEAWQRLGIEMGIVSNFDSRLYMVLEALELTQFFESVTISTEIGAAKPDERIFAAALNKHHCSPPEAWHIGDSFKEDYQGAKAVGIRAIWLERR
ncbi:MAG: HAD-IA family hydrolase [Kastovskya adunca ATA6-11-RM4]|jgi:putative hydrolase of the HAD superfamily|nr:HAD-IA family hydrolase [Kastovskya adunca ATA6-11-RM4]